MFQFEFCEVPYEKKEKVKGLAHRLKARIEWVPDQKRWRFHLPEGRLSGKRLASILEVAEETGAVLYVVRTVNGRIGEGGRIVARAIYPDDGRDGVAEKILGSAGPEPREGVEEAARYAEKREWALRAWKRGEKPGKEGGRR